MNLSSALLIASLAVSILPQSTAFYSNALHRNKPFQPSRTRPLHVFEVEAATATATATATGSATASAFAAIDTFFKLQPYAAAFITCSVKASAADMIAQSKEEPKPEELVKGSLQLPVRQSVDINRNLGFMLYGGLYTGVAQNFIYNVIYPAWFANDESWSLITKQVVVDNLVFAPFLCLPIAYAFKAAFKAGDLNLETLRGGIEKYLFDCMNKGLLSKYWSIWIPVQFMTFGVIPAHFRVAFVAAVSFFWIFILSSLLASEDEEVKLAAE
jgi:protein Mpv17